MTITGILYKLILGPLVLLFDVVYAMACRVTGDPGFSIVFLSLAMNLLVLPLYRRADALQEDERRQSIALQPGVSHIKKTFRGNERFMILQTYYRQNRYRPWYALKGSLSLLLEIPFFIAAYRFLSGLQLLQGVSFGPIRDLSLPDGLLLIGGRQVHLLPILMTLINIVSGAIYTRGMPARSKLQLYGMALVFLALLYPSPSGLVFYWTLNNLFSLVKNIFYKLRDPRKTLASLCAALGLALLAVLLFIRPMGSLRKQLVLVAVALALMAPLALRLLRGGRPVRPARPAGREESAVFILSAALLTVLTGLLIPSSVIRSSPAEFVNIESFRSPVIYIVGAALVAAGAFLVWGGIFYRLASPAGRRWLCFGALAAAGVGIADFMLFGRDYGNMSSTLQYDALIEIAGSRYLVNAAVVLALAAALYLLWRFRPALIRVVCTAAIIALSVTAFANVSAIQGNMASIQDTVSLASSREKATLPLRRNGKNVIVIMLDRAVGRLFPFLIEEKQELKRMFDGFTYYPNTISYGNYTNVGSPALFGGYDYTPENINLRSDVSLRDKQNEALRVMPVNFSDAGYEVTVCDPTYAGYSMIPDLSIYKDHPEIHAYITKGRFNADGKLSYRRLTAIWERNLFCYGIFRASPLLFQTTLYNNGLYNESDAQSSAGANAVSVVQTLDTPSTSTGTSQNFMDSYSVLTSLPDITVVSGAGRDTFLMLTNDTAHDVMLLQEPEYAPAAAVDNTEYDRAHYPRLAADGSKLFLKLKRQTTHYQCNMAALLQLGRWFDCLRENDVYDNTRIIIVSDHGRNLRLLKMKFDRSPASDLLLYSPLLLVKDFDSRQGLSTDERFMTNADTPTLAFRGLIDDPVNPDTGKPVTDALKGAPLQHVAYTRHWSPVAHQGNLLTGLTWLEVPNTLKVDEWTRSWRLMGKGTLPPED